MLFLSLMQWWCSGTLHFAHMRRALTLSLPTTVHCLQLRLLGLPLVLRWHNPVAQAVKSCLVSRAAADPPPDGHGAILAKQLQDQLQQEVQEGLLVACGLWKKRCSLFHKILSHLLLVFFIEKIDFYQHAKSPCIHSADVQIPCIHVEPPLLFPVGDPAVKYQQNYTL